jgi:hypothetical protein
VALFFHPDGARKNLMKISTDQLDDQTRIAARLIDLICEMSGGQHLELLKQPDKKQYKRGF